MNKILLKEVEDKNLFEEFIIKRGYKFEESYPIITNDPTVMFMNATVTPYKDKMIKGEYLKATALVQDCFRAKFDSEFLLYFKMLGMVSEISYLEKIFRDIIDYLDEFVGISIDELVMVVHEEDRDLIETWKKIINKEESIFYINKLTKNNHKYKTRWKYGNGFPITGRGVTITYNNKRKVKCGEKCNELCNCDKYLPIGNVIIVENSVNIKKYVEVGFGIEFMKALKINGDIFKIKEFSDVIEQIGKIGFDLKTSQKIFNYQRGIDRILGEKIIPYNKKHGYVLRKTIRKVVDLSIEKFGLANVEKIYGEIINIMNQLDTEEIGILNEEVTFYLKSIISNIEKAKKFIKKNKLENSNIIDRVKDTFGLSVCIIQKYVYEGL